MGVRRTLTNTDKLPVTADKLIGPDSVLDAELGSVLQEMGGDARVMRSFAKVSGDMPPRFGRRQMKNIAFARSSFRDFPAQAND